MTSWLIYVPGAVIVLAGVAAFRWLTALQHRVNDHAERIAHLEGERHPDR